MLTDRPDPTKSRHANPFLRVFFGYFEHFFSGFWAILRIFRRGNEGEIMRSFDSYLMRTKLPKDTSEKVMTFDRFSPLNSGGRPNAYAKTRYKAGSCIQESLLESLGLLIAP